jgi:hypothetical protein
VAEQKKDAKPEYATREDVGRAVDSLSRADEIRLEKFARYRIRGLGRKAMGRDHEDLLQEALNSTWIGAEDPNEGRRWRKTDVAFVQHLLGAMRSIASHWKEAADDDEAQLDSDLAVETDDGVVLSPVENAPSDTPDQERALIAKEQLGAIFRLFQNDDDAALVIEGIREGWNGPEIMERLALPKSRYEAALKRIRYHVK